MPGSPSESGSKDLDVAVTTVQQEVDCLLRLEVLAVAQPKIPSPLPSILCRSKSRRTDRDTSLTAAIRPQSWSTAKTLPLRLGSMT